MRVKRRVLSIVVRTAAFVVLASASVARAGELQVEVAPTFKKSTWRGDAGGGAQLRLGYRFAKAITLDAALWEELHSVDLRAQTGLTLGVTGTLPLDVLRPLLRVYFIHQHEQAWVSLKREPWTAVLGIGAGIRHRAGFGFSAGVEWPFLRAKRWEFFVAPAATVTIFPDVSLGPLAYFGAALAFGFSYNTEAEAQVEVEP